MIRRCETPSQGSYKYYGARGIRVCERWRRDFVAFLSDVGERPAPEYSIDRIDNDGHYEPGNVRWATRNEQIANSSMTQAERALVRWRKERARR